MNTDKIYAEQLANEYAPKDTSKVVALRKLDARAKRPASVFTYTFGIIVCAGHRDRHSGHGRYLRQLSDLQKAAGKRQAEICL